MQMVNHGSSSWLMMAQQMVRRKRSRELAKQDRKVRPIIFARNFGHQIAITAGWDYATGDAVVIIDGDLQDPPEIILDLGEEMERGL